jgi:hypothetical protein
MNGGGRSSSARPARTGTGGLSAAAAPHHMHWALPSPLNSNCRYYLSSLATSQGAGFVVGWGAGFAAGMAWYIGRYR